ncbi:MAG: DinB family protein [Chloroflexota bacterium]|nr:DinB family protein [Chloroflexota bacterium]
MKSSAIGKLLHYHYGMFERVWECAQDLTADQFAAESDYSVGSVRNHFVHCLNVDGRWLARLKGEAPPPLFNSTDYPDQDGIREQWEQVRQRALAYVDSLTEEDLNESAHVELEGRNLEARRFRRWEILLHIANHGTDHRAQILARLDELGAETIEQDLILHWWLNEGYSAKDG